MLVDHQGSIRQIVDNTGSLLNQITYDSYGNITHQTNPSVTFRFGYTGREWDGETGQYYYRARYYDARVGRFLSTDPIGFTAGDANLYRYVGNSPTNATDPSGERTAAPARPVSRPNYNNPSSRPPAPRPGFGTPGSAPSGGNTRNPTPYYPDTILRRQGDPNPMPSYQSPRWMLPQPGAPLKWPTERLGPAPSTPFWELERVVELMTPDLDPPWRERERWPSKCQLYYKVPGRPDQDFDYCVYRCRDWGADTIRRPIRRGGVCPKWLDYVPDFIPG
jgi:RHS repeat-associated protein